MPAPPVKRPRWPPPRRGDLLAVALLGAIVVALLVVGIMKPAVLSPNGASRGFDPDMECTGVGRGDPVCIRKSGLPRQ